MSFSSVFLGFPPVDNKISPTFSREIPVASYMFRWKTTEKTFCSTYGTFSNYTSVGSVLELLNVWRLRSQILGRDLCVRPVECEWFDMKDSFPNWVVTCLETTFHPISKCVRRVFVLVYTWSYTELRWANVVRHSRGDAYLWCNIRRAKVCPFLRIELRVSWRGRLWKHKSISRQNIDYSESLMYVPAFESGPTFWSFDYPFVNELPNEMCECYLHTYLVFWQSEK